MSAQITHIDPEETIRKLKAKVARLEKALAAQRQWVGLTDEEKRNICRVGPVYAPDGVVTRRPLEYRKELEGVALMAVRKAEAKLKEKNT
jgi:hypothetical protein